LQYDYDEEGRVVSGLLWCDGAKSGGVIAKYTHDPSSHPVEPRMVSAEYRDVPYDGKAEGQLVVHWNPFSSHIEVVDWRPYKDDGACPRSLLLCPPVF
jgi:hypothetical protein